MTWGDRLWVMAILGSALFSILMLAGQIIDERRADEAMNIFYATNCTYLGSRIERGWGSQKVYRYQCYEWVEETSLKPRSYPAVSE